MGEQEPRRATKGVRITKRVVDGVDLKRGRHVLWDSELKGFGLQVEPTGTKTYIVRYRPKGLGRSGPRRFVKLGRHGDVTPDEAREQAKIVLGKVAGGQDPADTRIAERLAYEQRKQAITVEQLGEVFLREHAKPLRKASTASNYEILLRRHINPALGGKIAHSLTRSEVAALHLSMHDAQASANRMLTLLSSMYFFWCQA